MQNTNHKTSGNYRRFKLITFVFILSILVVLAGYFLLPISLFANKTADIETLIQNTLSNSSIGMVVMDAKTGQLLWYYGAPVAAIKVVYL